MGDVQMKICPICEELMPDNHDVCMYCGYNFLPKHEKPKVNIEKKKNNKRVNDYKYMEFTKASLDEVNRWIDQHNGKIRIVDFYGSLRFFQIIGAMSKFSYQNLTIKYYEDVEGYEYRINKAQHVQLFFSDPLKDCLEDLRQIPQGYRQIGRIQKKARYSGGNGQTLACVVQLLERRID